MISVAAELAGVHPQTLRIYERKGLLRPQADAGNTRRYSERDVELLRAIQALTQEEGINLAGVKRIMEMRARWTSCVDASRSSRNSSRIAVRSRCRAAAPAPRSCRCGP